MIMRKNLGFIIRRTERLADLNERPDAYKMRIASLAAQIWWQFFYFRKFRKLF